MGGGVIHDSHVTSSILYVPSASFLFSKHQQDHAYCGPEDEEFWITVLMDGWTNKAMEDEIKRRKISIKYYLIRFQLQHASSPTQQRPIFCNSQGESIVLLLLIQLLGFRRFTTHSTDTH